MQIVRTIRKITAARDSFGASRKYLQKLYTIRIPYDAGDFSPTEDDAAERLRLRDAIALAESGIKRGDPRPLVFADEPGGDDAAPAVELPPLPPLLMRDLIEKLGVATDYLDKILLPRLKRAFKRPRQPEKERFCRDWYQFAYDRTGSPLYRQGAELFNLIFAK